MMLLSGAEGGIYRTRSILGVILLYLLKNLIEKNEQQVSLNGYLDG